MSSGSEPRWEVARHSVRMVCIMRRPTSRGVT
jgi:hypothetical protein